MMIDKNADAIASVFSEFGIEAVVEQAVNGPSVTRYEIKVGRGVKLEKIAALQKNIAYATASESVRILCPIPGRAAVGIELPRAEGRETVSLLDMLAQIPADAHPLTVAVGKSVDGDLITADLSKLPHLLVAGATGAGKSTAINSMLVSLLRRATPEQVRLTLVDPKMVELGQYDGIAHLLRPVVVEVDEAVSALNDLVETMEGRYERMKAAGVRHIDQLEGEPYIVLVVDELSDLIMQAGKAAELPLVRLAQKGRAAGVHCVTATQRPSADIISGLIKANFPSRLAFAVQSHVNSGIVLDESGAEQLLGHGDALFKPIGARSATRIQGAYVSDAEVAAAVAAATPVVVKKAGKAAPGLDAVMLDELIGYTQDAIDRIDRYLKMLNNPRVKQSDKQMAYYDLPLELGQAGISLDEIAHRLRKMRDAA